MRNAASGALQLHWYFLRLTLRPTMCAAGLKEDTRALDNNADPVAGVFFDCSLHQLVELFRPPPPATLRTLLVSLRRPSKRSEKCFGPKGNITADITLRM